MLPDVQLVLIQAGQDCDGHPHVMGPPVEELRADFPLRPACMGNLVPQQINLWMGAAPKGQHVQAPSIEHQWKV